MPDAFEEIAELASHCTDAELRRLCFANLAEYRQDHPDSTPGELQYYLIRFWASVPHSKICRIRPAARVLRQGHC